MIKKLGIVLISVLLLMSFVSCGETTPEGRATYVYSYTLEKAATYPVDHLDASLFYQPDLPEYDRDIRYFDTGLERKVKKNEIDVFGIEKSMAFDGAYERFPQYPLGVGSYAAFSYDNFSYDHTAKDRGRAHIRQETGEVLHLAVQSDSLLSAPALDDSDAVVAFATAQMKRYATFDGYTLFAVKNSKGCSFLKKSCLSCLLLSKPC